MPVDASPILSVIIISHNQRESLHRCLDSILAMRLSFPYEIIVSDDRSTDGSYELAQEYAQKKFDDNLLRIVALQCNSDACHPANNSHRSGYNRCNAYPHARGKYIAHVDADDYFRPNAVVYERQVAALEAHPECALAMSNCLSVAEHETDLSKGKPWPFPRKMMDGEVIEQEEFIRKDFFRLNQCFMQRRNPNIDPVALYGKRYVDSVITYHHLQFGKVVFVDACDYVWVSSATSITKQWAKQNHDIDIMWCLGIYIPVLIPHWRREWLMGLYYQQIRTMIKFALNNYRLQPSNYEALRDLHIWIYDCFGRNLNRKDMLRLKITDMWMKMMKKTRLEYDWMVKILWNLLTKE